MNKECLKAMEKAADYDWWVGFVKFFCKLSVIVLICFVVIPAIIGGNRYYYSDEIEVPSTADVVVILYGKYRGMVGVVGACTEQRCNVEIIYQFHPYEKYWANGSQITGTMQKITEDFRKKSLKVISRPNLDNP